MKSIRTFISESPGDTERFAEILSLLFKPGDVILLEGELGSGKTFLVKHICKNWGIEETVTSPTFTIINQYSGPVPVHHLDFYRINNRKELDHLGWEELLGGDSVTFIEWPHWIEPMVDEYYKIRIAVREKQRIFEIFLNS